MLIGELAEETGFSRDTIRYYERIHLLPDDLRSRGSNNYRQYDDAAVARLRAIRTLKEHGFTLSEVRDLLVHLESVESCTGLPDALREKVERIDRKLREMASYRDRLNQALDACRGSACSDGAPFVGEPSRHKPE